ncbi:hypothetical protein F5Y01DRAFT_308269 [Xylaria sp. FL0043]|nr:hypothetical protein F5Y01DRAFT_308269 [Xylaria sp. FL0043]
MNHFHKLTTEVCQCEVAADFDDDMVQDVMAIILFPTRYTVGIFSGPLRDHYMLWEAQTLPNPLRRLHVECNDAPSDHLRFLRAFLRYELLCKMRCSDNFADSDISWYYELSSLWKYKGQAFQQVEAEAIACVQSYYFSERSCSELSCFGFDLAIALLQAATAGKQARNHVQMWYHDLSERKWDEFMDYNNCMLGFDPLCEEDKHYTEGPGMYKMLYPIGHSSSMQRFLYRRKAWAFLDNLRFHPPRLQQLCFTGAD